MQPEERNTSRNAFDVEALRGGIASRLRAFRESTGLQQGEFADKSGIPRPSYKDYEGGKSSPGAVALIQLQAQGLNINWLLTSEGSMNAGEAAPLQINEQVLIGVVEAIENFLTERKLKLAATKKGELIAVLYEACLPEGEAKPTVVNRILRLVA